MITLYGKNYRSSPELILEDGLVPLTYWTLKPNFGDLLSAYVVEKLTGLGVKHVYLRPGALDRPVVKLLRRDRFSYFAIGSIIRRINSKSIVWGSGAFGTEGKHDFNPKAKILAVRGPLTRNLLRIHGRNCPDIYGDPALIVPQLFNPPVKKKYRVGVILRWAEDEWDRANFSPDVKKINMSATDIEGTLEEMLECEAIFSSSLHGIVLADAYGIPSAWLSSTTPKGLHFKFYDYYISVGKIQKPQDFDFSRSEISAERILSEIEFNDKIIEFDHEALIDACPFIAAV